MSLFSDRAAIRHFWDKAVAPPLALKDPVGRHRARFLNMLLVSFIPVAPLVLIFQILITPNLNLAEDSSPKAVGMGLAIVLIIYVVNHTRYFWLANYAAIAIGFAAIIINAAISDQPHVEIAYLIILPLAGVLLLSLFENVIVCVLTIVCLFVFAKLMGDIPDDILKDVLTLCLIVEAIIIFVSHQRNELEVERQQQVVEVEKMRILAQFIQDISHEFRTPLSIISTGLYLLNKSQDPHGRQQRIMLIEQQITYLAKLLEDMLMMSRLDSRTSSMTAGWLDLDDLIRELVTTMEPDASAKGLTIELTLQPDLAKIEGNAGELQLALSHLLKNAISYTAQGRINVKAFRQQNSTIIEFEDTGIGIPEADCSRIFERFYRVDQARSTPGAGLGLAITKKIIENHNGKIEVESVPGQGSLFRVTLPEVLHKAN